MKYFFPHQPYGKQKQYVQKLMKASSERPAHLIKVCDLLLQTKVYLFWSDLAELTGPSFAQAEPRKKSMI
jgi:hypothetical protein